MGRSGSGKTHRCYDEIIQASYKNKEQPLILLVPEQFTLQTQKDIVSRHPSRGIMSIEVLSFQRLAYRVFDEVGGTNRKLLEETGKSMVIRKVLEEEKQRLKLFNKNMDKPGVINEIKSAITEFYQYQLSEEQLAATLDKTKEQPLLQTKLQDLAIIYSGFKDFLKDHYMTVEEILDLLSERLGDAQMIKASQIWIDGFTGFTPVQYKVIEELMKHCRNINITLTLDPAEPLDQMDRYQLFYESKKTYHHLKTLAEAVKCPLTTTWIDEDIPIRFAKQPTLAHLERYLFRHPYKVAKDEPEGIQVYIADQLQKEVDQVAREITTWVRDKGYRYKEIAIITGDIDRYEGLIKKIFGQYEIPYFIDQKKSILSNPMVDMIRTTFEIMVKNWTYESVFSWLRTGLSPLSKEEIDSLENYVIAYGIRGRKKWKEEWNKPYPRASKEVEIITKEALNELKNRGIEPLHQLEEELTGRSHVVKDVTTSLYHVLKKLRIEEKARGYADKFCEEEELLLERQYAQIYRLIIDLLDKIVEVLGEEKVTLKTYAHILDAGLEQVQMGLVPPGLDQVVIGDIERTRLKDIQVLFLIGANEGVIPKMSQSGSILSDRDREVLEDQGMTLAPTTKQKNYEEQFNLFLNLTKPQQHLMISLSKLDAQFKTLRVSNLVGQVSKLFKTLKIKTGEDTFGLDAIGLPKSTMRYLVEEMRYYKSREMDAVWKELYQWYQRQPQWQAKINKLVEGVFHKNKAPYLTLEQAEDLYSHYLINSVTRLEQFAMCPFSHFMKYGLKATERAKYEISIPDLGIIFHQAIETYSKKLVHRQIDWADVTPEQRDQWVEEAVIEVVEGYGHQLFYSSSRNEYLINRVTRITKRTVWALQKHIESGDFRPTAYEVAFSTSKDQLDDLQIRFSEKQKLDLSGRIDRIDTYEDEEAVYLKVIDYKSGRQAFDMVAIYHGLQLQLMVYLKAAWALEKNKRDEKDVLPAGVFYYHMDDPMLLVEGPLSKEAREEALLNKLKMDGLVLEDKAVIQLMDRTTQKQSSILPVKFKNNGDFAKGSSVASKENFQELTAYVEDKIKILGEDMLRGNVGIEPYAYKDRKACDYCQYASVCQFDPLLDNRYRILNKLPEEIVWKNIKRQWEEKNKKD